MDSISIIVLFFGIEVESSSKSFDELLSDESPTDEVLVVVVVVAFVGDTIGAADKVVVGGVRKCIASSTLHESRQETESSMRLFMFVANSRAEHSTIDTEVHAAGLMRNGSGNK